MAIGDNGLNIPASSDVNATVAADVDAAVAAAAGLRVVGYSARETAGSTAVAKIVNGATGAGGSAIMNIGLTANDSKVEWCWPGIDAAAGISIDHVSGALDITIFYITVT